MMSVGYFGQPEVARRVLYEVFIRIILLNCVFAVNRETTVTKVGYYSFIHSFREICIADYR
jgi:hypothetical protein